MAWDQARNVGLCGLRFFLAGFNQMPLHQLRQPAQGGM